MKTIALVDTFWIGHHPTYFKIFSKTLLELGCQTLAFCPEPEELRQWIATNCPQKIHLFHSFELQQPKLSSYLSELAPHALVTLANWRHTAVTIHKATTKIDTTLNLVFFAWLDNYLNPYLVYPLIEQVFPYDWSGLCFRFYKTQLHQQFLSSITRQGNLNRYTIFKSKRCRSIATLNENMVDSLKVRLNNQPIIVFPDFTDESPPDLNFSIMQQIRTKAAGRKIVGLLGSLDRRKGLLSLLNIAQQLATQNYFFVFAGKFGKESFTRQELVKIDKIVNANPDNCFFYFEQIPDEAQFNSLVNVCDVLFAVYTNFPYSSNILTKAAVFEKPVVVSNKFCMGERVRKFNLGIAVDEGDINQCIDALQQLCFQHSGDRTQHRNFSAYRQLHSLNRLSTAFSAILDYESVVFNY